MGNEDERYYIRQAIDDIDVIRSYTLDLSYEEFSRDGRTVDATMFRLQQMIEKIKSLSETFKRQHPDVPWGEIIGFRNGIVHAYGKVNLMTVYEIVSHDILELRGLFLSALGL